MSIQFLVERIDSLAETERKLKAAGGEETARLPEIAAIDGKTGKGGKRNKTDRDAVKAMHTVSAYSTDRGLGLSEVVVNEKGSEIPAVRDLLDIINVSGRIVTWGALNTQMSCPR